MKENENNLSLTILCLMAKKKGNDEKEVMEHQEGKKKKNVKIRNMGKTG